VTDDLTTELSYHNPLSTISNSSFPLKQALQPEYCLHEINIQQKIVTLHMILALVI